MKFGMHVVLKSNMFFFNGDVEKRKFTSLFIPLIALLLNRSSTCRRKIYETSDSIFLTFKKYLSHFKNTEGRSRSSHLFKASLIFHWSRKWKDIWRKKNTIREIFSIDTRSYIFVPIITHSVLAASHIGIFVVVVELHSPVEVEYCLERTIDGVHN